MADGGRRRASAAARPERYERVGSRLDRWRDHAAVPVVLTALAYLLVLVVVLRRHDFQPGALVQAGTGFAEPGAVPPGLVVWPGTNGYDGQFYYRLALDPFTDRVTAFGITLDSAPYRQQRLLLPWLAWLASLGQPERVPTAIIGLNFAGLLGLAWVGWALARRSGLLGLWGIGVPLFAGFVYSLIRDLTEIVALMCLLAGLLCARSARTWPAAALLALAVLGRETALIAAGAIGAVWLWSRWRGRDPAPLRWPMWAVPGAVYLLWQGWLVWRWGTLPAQAVRGALAPPFSQWWVALSAAASVATYEQQRWLVELAALGALWLAGCALLRVSRAPAHEKLAWIAYAALAPVLGSDIWAHDLGFLRPLSEFVELAVLMAFAAPRRWRLPVVGGQLAIWLLVVVQLVLFYR